MNVVGWVGEDVQHAREILIHLGDGGSRCRDLANDPQFARVVEVQGVLHVWMTTIRTMLKILDPCLGRILALEMNFSSPAAQEFYLRGKCIHKAWESLQLVMEVIMDAFRVSFFKVDGGANTGKNESDFVLWLEFDHDDEQFAFYSFLVRVLMPALMCMAKGTRQKDLETYTSAHRVFLMVWFLFGNSSYGPDSLLDILTWFHRANDNIFNFYEAYCWSVDGQGAEGPVCEESIRAVKENVTGKMNADNLKISTCTTEKSKGLRERNMKRAGLKEADLAQRTPTEKEWFRKRMTARALKEGMLEPVKGRKGVRPIDGVGMMEEGCTSWTAMFAIAEERLEAFHTADPATRKFPPAIRYGLVGKDAVFSSDEDSHADSDIRFVTEAVASAIDEGQYFSETDD